MGKRFKKQLSTTDRGRCGASARQPFLVSALKGNSSSCSSRTRLCGIHLISLIGILLIYPRERQLVFHIQKRMRVKSLYINTLQWSALLLKGERVVSGGTAACLCQIAMTTKSHSQDVNLHEPPSGFRSSEFNL